MNKELEKKFDEIFFVACPTEEKEPFFWRWTKEGKKALLSHIDKHYIAKERCDKDAADVVENMVGHKARNLYSKQQVLDILKSHGVIVDDL